MKQKTLSGAVTATQIAIFVLVAGAMVTPGAAFGGDETTSREDPTEKVGVPDTLDPYVEKISESLSEFEMQPVPGGTVTLKTENETRSFEVGPFWIKATEVKWEPYKTFMYGRDQQESAEIDAVSRPTNALSYIAAHFGGPKEGHPARAMTRKAARNYARWLTQKTEHEYRLPTAAEWVHACQLGMNEGRDNLDKYAWHSGNSEGETHPVGSKAGASLGVHDLLGNLAEWTFTPSNEDRRVLRGGSYQTKRSKVRCSASIREKTKLWKQTDPQLPKSKWWFSDAPFVGFRIVRVPEEE